MSIINPTTTFLTTTFLTTTILTTKITTTQKQSTINIEIKKNQKTHKDVDNKATIRKHENLKK